MNSTLKLSLILFGLQSSHGFLSFYSAQPSRTLPQPPSSLYSSGLEQLPGESDIEFIKRITSEGIEKRRNNNTATTKPKGKYQKIEDWDAERKEKGILSWEEKVQYDGQRHGNQFRQNDILTRNLHSF